MFATERFDQYILGKNSVNVLTDHKPLMSIFKKSILTCPKRLQRMRLRLQKYSLKVNYKPGPQMYVSDTLSRASLPETEVSDNTPHYIVYRVESERSFQEELERISMEEDLFVSDDRLHQIRMETGSDQSLQTLRSIVSGGWPEDKAQVPLCIRDYWPYREEISTQNGLLYRGTRVIIPSSIRAEMLDRAHRSHMGIQYTLNTAREIMFWPKMHNDITETVQKCSTCQESQPANQPEPLMTSPLPKLPWQVVASVW